MTSSPVVIALLYVLRFLQPLRKSASLRLQLQLLVFVLITAIAEAVPPATPETVGDVIQLIKAQRAAIHGMMVKYESHTELDPVLLREGRLGGVQTDIKATFAFAGELRHMTVLATGILDNGAKDIKPIATTVFDGKEYRYRQGKSLVILKDHSDNCELNAYTNVLKWPFTRAEKQHANEDPDKAHFMPEMLLAPGWELSREIQGSFCHLIVKNERLGREIHFNEEAGYSMVSFVHRDPLPDIDAWTVDTEDFVHIKDIWLPRKIIAKQRFKQTGSFSAGNVTTTVSVKELKLNDDVDIALFTLVPQPGELVKDEKRDVIYRFVPAGDSTLDDSVLEANRLGPAAPSRLLWINIGFAFGILVVWFVTRKGKTRRDK